MRFLRLAGEISEDVCQVSGVRQQNGKMERI